MLVRKFLAVMFHFLLFELASLWILTNLYESALSEYYLFFIFHFWSNLACGAESQEYSNSPEFHPFLSSCCDICQYDITFRSTRVWPFVCRESQRELKSLRVYDGSWKVAWEISIWKPFWRRIHENNFNSVSTRINMGFYKDLRISE